MREGRWTPTCDVATEACLPVDMLSEGDNPSSRPCSRVWEAVGGTVGGWGGGRLGLCLGFGVGRDFVSVPVREGGEDNVWGPPNGVWPGEEVGACPGG